MIPVIKIRPHLGAFRAHFYKEVHGDNLQPDLGDRRGDLTLDMSRGQTCSC